MATTTIDAKPRFVALDVHKHYLVVGALTAPQEIVLQPKRVELPAFPTWARTQLRATDQVVLEMSTNTWELVDLLTPLVAKVIVANPLKVRLIATARVKTDAADTLILARLLAAGLVPEVWVPPPAVRELRALIAHRRRLVANRTQARNRLQGMLHRHNLLPPEGGLFAPAQRTWWTELQLDTSERLRVRQDLSLLDSLEPLISEVEAELVRLSQTAPWAEQVPYLIQLPGMGVLTAMVILAAIGEATRFPSAKQLVGYSGLGASVHASGQTYHTGGITKQGRRELRHALVEAAWAAIAHHPHWKSVFTRLSARLGKNKALIAIARKLLVVVWHVLTERQADQHADAHQVALKLVVWGRQLGPRGRQGLKTSVFVRRELMRLGLGADLEQIGWPSVQAARLPSEEEVRHLLAAANAPPQEDTVAVA
jgi:transposase